MWMCDSAKAINKQHFIIFQGNGHHIHCSLKSILSWKSISSYFKPFLILDFPWISRKWLTRHHLNILTRGDLFLSEFHCFGRTDDLHRRPPWSCSAAGRRTPMPCAVKALRRPVWSSMVRDTQWAGGKYRWTQHRGERLGVSCFGGCLLGEAATILWSLG